MTTGQQEESSQNCIFNWLQKRDFLAEGTSKYTGFFFISNTWSVKTNNNVEMYT